MNKWISVKENLPPHFHSVIVWWPEAALDLDIGENFRIAQFGPQGWRSEPNVFGEVADSGRGLPGPTHWMRPEVPDVE